MVTINVTNVEELGTVTLSSVQPQVGTDLTANLTDPDGEITGVTWKWESFFEPEQRLDRHQRSYVSHRYPEHQ